MSSDLNVLMGDEMLGIRQPGTPGSYRTLASPPVRFPTSKPHFPSQPQSQTANVLPQSDTSFSLVASLAPVQTSTCILPGTPGHDTSQGSNDPTGHFGDILHDASDHSFGDSELALDCNNTLMTPTSSTSRDSLYCQAFFNYPWHAQFAETMCDSEYVCPTDLDLVPVASSGPSRAIGPSNRTDERVSSATSAQHHVANANRFMDKRSSIDAYSHLISALGLDSRLPDAKPIDPITAWLQKNAASPYPSEKDLSSLVSATGLTIRQVRARLNNQRARGKTSATGCAPASTSNPDLGYRLGNSFNTRSISYQTENVVISPWDSPCSTIFSPLNFLDDQEVDPSFDNAIQGFPVIGTPLPSNISTAGFASPTRKTKRKGKRVYPSRYNTQILPTFSCVTSDESTGSPGDEERYHCTLCPKSFKTAYGWKRHEAGVHEFHIHEWICMLGEVLLKGQLCVFCGDEATSMHHFEQHNIAACFHKDQAARTFARKDLLKQHIQFMHLGNADEEAKKSFQVPDFWVKDVEASRSDPASLWCGFCRESLSSTAIRMEHVVSHFRDGTFHMAVDWMPYGFG